MTSAGTGAPVEARAPDGPVDEPRCPYVGLVPFDEKDADRFFGRRREIGVLAANLRASRLTLLYAPSGIGKTSILRAGLVPFTRRAARDALDPDDDPDDVVYGPAVTAYARHWSSPPRVALAEAVVAGVAANDSALVPRLPEVSPGHELGPDWYAQVLDVTRAESLLLVLDQFEEYFLHNPDERKDFGLETILGGLLRRRDLRVNVMISIREDALGRLDRLEGTVPRLFDNYLRLAHLSRDEAREAVELPLEWFNTQVGPRHAVRLEDGLVGRVLDEVEVGRLTVEEEDPASTATPATRPDIEAPFLQLVMVRLWIEEARCGSRVLREETLTRLGGARTIVQRHLDTVMADLSVEQRDLAALVLRHLVTLGGTKVTLGADDLAEITETPPAEVESLLEELSDGERRVLRPVPAPGGAPAYEIFHDVLAGAILSWRRRHLIDMERRHAAAAVAQERAVSAAEIAVTRRLLRRTRLLALALVGMLLIVAGLLVGTVVAQRDAEAARLLGAAAERSPDSLRLAVAAHDLSPDEASAAAVVLAAADPAATVVATPPGGAQDLVPAGPGRHVAVGAGGGVEVVDDDGDVVARTVLPGLTGRVVAAAAADGGDRVAAVDETGRLVVRPAAGAAPVPLRVPPGTSHLTWVGSTEAPAILATGAGVALIPLGGPPGLGATRLDLPAPATAVLAPAGFAPEARLVVADGARLVSRPVAGEPDSVSVALPTPGRVLGLWPVGRSVLALIATDGGPEQIVAWDTARGAPAVLPVDLASGVLRGAEVGGSGRTLTLIRDGSTQTIDPADATTDLASKGVGGPSVTVPRSGRGLTDAAVSPDGRWLAVAGDDDEVELWPHGGAGATAPALTLPGHTGGVAHLAWSTSGQVLYTAGRDGVLRRWSVPVVSRSDVPGPATGVSADGASVVAVAGDGTVTVRSPEADRAGPAVMSGAGQASFLDVRATPNGPVVVVAAPDGAPRVWRSGVLSTMAALPGRIDASWTDVALAGDGALLAAADSLGQVGVWDTSTGAVRAGPLPIPAESGVASGPITSVAVSSRGDLVAAAAGDRAVVWARDPGGSYVVRDIHPLDDVASVAFDATGQRLVVATAGHDIRVWDLSAPDTTEPVDLTGAGRFASDPVVSADGVHIAIGDDEGRLQVFDLERRTLVFADRLHREAVTSVGFDAGGRIVTTGRDRSVVVRSCAGCSDPDRYLGGLIASQSPTN